MVQRALPYLKAKAVEKLLLAVGLMACSLWAQAPDEVACGSSFVTALGLFAPTGHLSPLSVATTPSGLQFQ